MEEKSSARFSEYLFAKMDGQDVSASQGPRKVTADTRKFMRENLLLVVTLSGVLFGVILGEYPRIIKSLGLHRAESSHRSASKQIIDMPSKCQSRARSARKEGRSRSNIQSGDEL